MTLALEALQVKLGRFTLGPVSVSVPVGGVTVILGPNGSGKSTLLRAACGLQSLAAGRVSLAGQVVHACSSAWRASRIAFVAQRPAVPPALSVREVVGLACLRRTDAAAVRSALEEVGLLDRAGEPLDHLSEGQRHRAALARALVQLHAGCSVLAVDEPTASLDPAWSARLVQRLRQAAREGLTVVLATHDLVFAAACADRAVLLRQGSVQAEGPASEVLAEGPLQQAFGTPFEPFTRQDGRGVIVPRW